MNSPAIILSLALLLCMPGCSGKADPCRGRSEEPPIELSPRITIQEDRYRVHIDLKWLNIPRFHGLAEVELLAVGGTSVPMCPGTLEGVAAGSIGRSGYVAADFERAVAPSRLSALTFRLPKYAARWRISVMEPGEVRLYPVEREDEREAYRK